MILIGFFCFLIFLFTTYQLSRDDFLFLRKGITTEDVFNVVFTSLPFIFLFSRLFYIFLHPNARFFNPFIFFLVPYFPGLSLIGGIIGGWIFVIFFTKEGKMPRFRLLDILSISFLLSLSIAILLQAFFLFSTRKLLGIEEIGRSMLGIAFFIFSIVQLGENKWVEGSIATMIICVYCLLAVLSTVFLYFSQKTINIPSLIVTILLFLLAIGMFIKREGYIQKFFGR